MSTFFLEIIDKHRDSHCSDVGALQSVHCYSYMRREEGREARREEQREGRRERGGGKGEITTRLYQV